MASSPPPTPSTEWWIPKIGTLAIAGWVCLVVGVVSFGVGIAGGILLATVGVLRWMEKRSPRP